MPDSGVVLAVVAALVFAATNGVHDAANAIATLVATRAARPGPAVLLAAVGQHRRPAPVRQRGRRTPIEGIVTVPNNEVIPVLGAALTGAVAWNCITWARGLPSSSGHALLGGLVGAAIAEGGTGAVNWGGFDGIVPVGVIGVAVVLTVAPVLGFLAGLAVDRGAREAARRATRRVRGPGARRAMGDVGLARALPRRQRRAEGRRRRRAPARRRRRAPPADVADLGGARVRCRPHRGHRDRRLADRQDPRAADHPDRARSTRSRARPGRARSCSARR